MSEKTFKWVTRILLFLGFILSLIFILSISLLVLDTHINELNDQGKFFNSFTAPFIGVLAVLTTFLAFLVQYESNLDQRKDIKIERFENQFYQMLHLHKSNVSELEIAGRYIGRKAFVKMYYEYRYLYLLLRRLYVDNNWNMHHELDKFICKVAYHHFFFGVDKNTNVVYNQTFNSVEQEFLDTIKNEQLLFEIYKRSCFDDGLELVNDPYVTRSGMEFELETDFYPFDGHVSKLGHYYRHLYQTIKYISWDNDRIKLSWDQRYKYLKILRAQLSNHEQSLIYFNSFWVWGDVWWEEKISDKEKISYFIDFALIKNLPFSLTKQFGPDPEEEFSIRLGEPPYYIDPDDKPVSKEDKIKWLFEWKGG